MWLKKVYSEVFGVADHEFSIVIAKLICLNKLCLRFKIFAKRPPPTQPKNKILFGLLISLASLWLAKRQAFAAPQYKRRGDSKVYHFKSFAPIDLKFWHNILEMLYYKKMQEKHRFFKSARPYAPLNVFKSMSSLLTHIFMSTNKFSNQNVRCLSTKYKW